MFQFRRFPSYTYLFSIWCYIFNVTDFSIRTSADHNLLAIPRSFSQLTASFFGSQCQGILPALLLAWPFFSDWSRNYASSFFEKLRNLDFCQNCSILVNGIRNLTWNQAKICIYDFCADWKRKFQCRLLYLPNGFHRLIFNTLFPHCITFALFSFQDAFYALSCAWWAQVDSNHRPHAYQACALTAWAMRPFRD